MYDSENYLQARRKPNNEEVNPINSTLRNTFRTLIAVVAVIATSGLSIAQDQGQPESDVRTATVTQMQIAGSYVYLQVVEDGEEVWLATSPGFIKDINYGDVIEFLSDVEMQDFHSKALDRTFKSLWFVSQVRVKQDTP